MGPFTPWRWRNAAVRDSPAGAYPTLSSVLSATAQNESKESLPVDDFAYPSEKSSPWPAPVPPLRPHFGTASRLTGYLTIIPSFLGAVLVAAMNHVAFSWLDRTLTGDPTHQFRVNTLKNVFPAAVALLLFVSLKCCLSQVALHRVRGGSHSLALVNLLTSSPSVLSILLILFKSSMRLAILWFVALAAVTQAVGLISLFVPGTLTITATKPYTTSLGVPTVDLGVVDTATSTSFLGQAPLSNGLWSFDRVETSPHWRQIVTRAATSNVAPTWDAPVECANACNYTFEYNAPAFNCTNLSTLDIWPGKSNDTQSHLAFPVASSSGTGVPVYGIYNSSFALVTEPTDTTNPTVFTLDVYYMEGFNTTRDQKFRMLTESLDPTQYTPRGARCSVVNATYEAATSFSKNTHVTSTRVKDLDDFKAFDTPPLSNSPQVATVNATVASYSIAQALGAILAGNATYNTSILQANTQAFVIPLWNMSSVQQSQSDVRSGGGAFSLSLSRDFNDLASGLQSLLGNVTLGFVNEKMAFASTNVTVDPGTTEFQYNGQKLVMIYSIAFGISVVVLVQGLWCLWANGTTAVFDMEHIIEMTAESVGLHAAALRPRFSSTPIRGVLCYDRGSRVVLDVNTERKQA